MSLPTRYSRLLVAAGCLLLLPLLAMPFTDEVNWTAGDFLVMGALLFALVSAVEIIWRKTERGEVRYLWIALAVLLFLLIWAELAVGIFGTPFAGS